MKLHSGMLLLCLAAGGAADALAQAADQPPGDSRPAGAPSKSPFLGGFLRETRVIYPLRHDGWEARDEHLYDTQELGASVRYVDGRHADRWLDLYFYPAGVLTPEEFEASMRNEREALLEAGRPGAAYTDMEMGPTQQFQYRGYRADGRKGDKATGYSVDLQMAREGIRLHSAMTLQLDRLYFVKARLSTPERDESRESLRRRLEKFVSGLAARVVVMSTGECWMPMPIEPLSAKDGKAQGLFTMDSDGTTSAIVTRDKVFAADPASIEARGAMLLGMSMTGRLVPGCEPAEELNQPVEEGMRELRLEYRSPEPLHDASSPSLRPVRVGRG
jgi:hypothetical protein